MLDDAAKALRAQTVARLGDDRRVSALDAQRRGARAADVEGARQKAESPRRRWVPRPRQGAPQHVVARPSLGRPHRWRLQCHRGGSTASRPCPARAPRRGVARGDRACARGPRGSRCCPPPARRGRAACAPVPRVRTARGGASSALVRAGPCDRAQIAAAVVGVLRRAGAEAPGAEHVVADHEVRPGGAGDVLEAAPGQEAVVAAGDQLGAVLELDPVAGLDRPPVIEDFGLGVSALGAFARGSVDAIAGPQVGQRAWPAVGQQDRRLPFQAVGAGMGAAAVWVDGPGERDARDGWDAVERRFGAHLVEADVQRLGRVEAAHHRGSETG